MKGGGSDCPCSRTSCRRHRSLPENFPHHIGVRENPAVTQYPVRPPSDEERELGLQALEILSSSFFGDADQSLSYEIFDQILEDAELPEDVAEDEKLLYAVVQAFTGMLTVARFLVAMRAAETSTEFADTLQALARIFNQPAE